MRPYGATEYLEHMKHHHRAANWQNAIAIVLGVTASFQGHPLAGLLVLGVMHLIGVKTELALIRGLMENAR